MKVFVTGGDKVKLYLFILLICTVCITGCNNADRKNEATKTPTPTQEVNDSVITEENETSALTQEDGDSLSAEETSNWAGIGEEQTAQEELELFIHPEGTTLETRIETPSGYHRVNASEDSLSSFLRDYPLKEDKSPVLLYDGTEKGNQEDHIAVFQLLLENEDLQQCADSVIRIYGEYFMHTEQYERISFHFVNGFEANYEKWREGYRIQVDGNDTSWVKTAPYDDSMETFKKYLRIVFAYSSTLSMEEESEEINLSDLQVGDIFIRGGSPGHVVMLVDLCENEEGKKAFLLGQGYMPAQEFHVIKNPSHESDPWYYEEEITYPFVTPSYTFEDGSLRRLEY